ncbi:MAG: hypothetical protein ACHQ6T_13685, partial [Myxococcota bacterium]
MATRALSLLAAAAVLIPAVSRASAITSDPNLPALYPGAAYVYPNGQPTYSGVGVTVAFDGVQDRASGPVTRTTNAGDEQESYNSLWVGTVSVNGGASVAMTASGTELTLTHGKAGVTAGTFSAEILAMSLSVSSSYGPLLVRESPTKASTGQTTITPQGGGLFQIDSFFDVFTELSVDGGQTWIPSS